MTDNVGVAAILRLWHLSEAGCCRRRGAFSARRAAAEMVASAILSVPGATLRVMDTLSDISDTNYEIPLSEAELSTRPHRTLLVELRSCCRR